MTVESAAPASPAAASTSTTTEAAPAPAVVEKTGEQPAATGTETKKPEPVVERVTPREVLEFRQNEQRVRELQQRLEQDTASLKDLRELKQRLDALGDDHLARAQVLGVDIESVAKHYAERGPIDPELIRQRQEMAELKQRQQEAEKNAAQERQHRQQLQIRALVQAEHGKIEAMLKSSGDRFELTRAWSTPEDVFRVADSALRQGAPMPKSAAEYQALYEKAAEIIEKTHEGRLESSADLKKLEAVLKRARDARAAAAGKGKDAAAVVAPADEKAKGAGDGKGKRERRLSRKEEEAILIREIESKMKATGG